MAWIISRVLDAPKSVRFTALDEMEICRGNNDRVAERMRRLREKAKRYGYKSESGVLNNGRVYLRVEFPSGKIERFECVLD